MQDGPLVGDREIRDAAAIGAVDPSGTPTAVRTSGRRRYAPQLDVEDVVNAEDALDARPCQVGQWDGNVQGEASDQDASITRVPALV